MANSTMDLYCGSEFWDLNRTWYTEDPDLTKCFEKTVLVWIPCLFLWIFSILEVWYIINSKKRDIPWNWLNISKLLVTGALIVLTISDVIYVVVNRGSVEEGKDIFSVDIYTPLIKIFSFTLSGLFVYYNRKHGLCTSGLQFLFWLLLAICGAFQFRTEIREGRTKSEVDYSYISYLIYYPLVLLILFLNCFADQSPRQTEYEKQRHPCPEETSSFLSKLLFSWFDPLAWIGWRRPLVETDLWDMKHEDSAEEVVPLFEKHWIKSLQKCENRSPSHQTRASFKTDSARVDFVHSSPKKKQASVLPALVKAFGPTFIFGALLKFIQDLLTFVSPQILNLLIQFVKNDEEQWKGYFYATLLFITATIQTIMLSQYFNRMFIVGMRIRTALVSAIYKKALRISNKAKKESTVGEIVNLMAVDAQKFIDLTAYINMIWSAPLQIILALSFLWAILGPSVLAGLAVMIFLIPVNGFIANKVKTLQIKQMKNKDERVKLMNEVLSGIKVLKLYAWEPSFERQILNIRDKEIQVLRQAAYLNGGTSFIWSCAPFLVTLLTFMVYIYSDSTNVLTPEKAFVSLSLFCIMSIPMSLLPMLVVYAMEVSLVSFATFVMVSEDNVLDASKAFVSVSLFNILRFPLSMLPMIISNMVQAAVSIGRINKFMNNEELDPTSVTHEPTDAPLLIENGYFSWGDDPTLKDINVRFKKGSLTAVVGTVGSGKSSLISAFLGEMDKTSGRVNTIGSIAYVAQQAWIQNATLRDNILFGRAFNKIEYDRVLEVCALKPDLEMLPAGDQTEIGEKGINLSGGQKQRISLARAVYANSDIYFLDDPLSAVDSHVGKHIFEHVIGPNGVLKRKTRVLVTHGITYLPYVTQIIVLKDGEISESGTYQELLNRKGAFAEFLLQHVNNEDDDDEDLDELKTQLGGTPVGEELLNKKIARQRSRLSESVSESGSVDHNSLIRQRSLDSTERSLKPITNSVDGKKVPMDNEKLIEAEKAETGSVKWVVYKHYFKSIGVFLTVITIFLNMAYQGFSIGSNIWLGIWSNDKEMKVNDTVNAGKRDFYLGIYGALGIGQAIGSVVIVVLPFYGCFRASVIMHEFMLRGILRAPMSFLETTPIGRILSRFSKDINVTDDVLPWCIIEGIELTLEWKKLNHLRISAIGSIFIVVLPFYGCLRASIRMHKYMLRGILRAPMSFLDTTPIGRILGRFSKDIQIMDVALPLSIINGLDLTLEVVGTLVVISYTTPIFVVVIIPIGIVYYFIQRFYVSTSRQLKRLESVSRSPIYSHFGETITGVQVIRAYREQDRFINESEHRVDVNQVCYYPSIISNRWLAVRLEMIGNLIILFAALFAVIGKDQDPGLVGLSVTYSLQITQTLNWLVRMSSDVETNIVAVERIKEYGESPQEAPWEIKSTPLPADWPTDGSVALQNYSVRYRPGLDLVLKGINFKIKGGEKVGIVGRTGAGKSSLTLALFRIIEPAEGEIVIDTVNISTIGLHTLRSRLTIIPQDAVLFSGTLRMNLDPFDKYSDEDVWRALEHAHLKAFVKGLTAGLHHEVSEGGENLSVGQRQLICLSRALLRKTKILILDEATAAVDLETDDLIQRTIRTEFKDCTVLTIAHRLNTIMDSDRVIVLDKGRIVEFDSPTNLLKQQTIFHSMCKDAGLV